MPFFHSFESLSQKAMVGSEGPINTSSTGTLRAMSIASPSKPCGVKGTSLNKIKKFGKSLPVLIIHDPHWIGLDPVLNDVIW